MSTSATGGRLPPGRRDHQHLMWQVCGDVIEIPDAVFADLSAQLLADYDFCIRSRHFAVLGRCQTCLSS